MLKELTCKVKEYITWILFGLVSFFAIHMIVFTNYFPCWDTYGSLQAGYTAMRNVGRWLYGPASVFLHSPYDLEWAAGVFSALFVTGASILMIDLWEIKRSIHRGIVIFLVAAFPSMTATYVYMFTAAAYMLAFFLAIMGVYILQKETSRKSILLSGVCLMLSLAIYQAYFLAAAGMFVLFLVSELLQGVEFETIKKHMLRFVSACGIGGVSYKVVEVIYTKIDNYNLSNYQGISDVGSITFISVWNGVIKSLCDIKKFYFWNESCLYRIINIILLGLAFISILREILINKRIKHFRKIIIAVLCLCVIPLTYGYYYISPSVEYHRIMEFGNVFIYIIPLIFFEHSNTDNVEAILQKMIKRACLCMLVILCFYHFRNDNIIYKQLEVYAERTRYETYEIIQRIDNAYGAGTKEVAVIGFFRLEPRDYKIEPVPDTVGIMRNYHAVPQSFVNFARFYYARNYYLASDDVIEKIKETEDYKSMDRYPYGDYVKVIDGIIVIKM